MLLGPFPRLPNSESLFWSLKGFLVVAVAGGGVAVGAVVAPAAASFKNKAFALITNQDEKLSAVLQRKKSVINQFFKTQQYIIV